MLVVILTSAILTVGVGVFNVLYGQIIIVGKADYSFQALYAADIGVEQTLYRDRQLDVCGVFPFPCDMPPTKYAYPYGAADHALCYHVDLDITPGACGAGTTRCMQVTGQYTCIPTFDGATRFVRRAFQLVY